MGTKPGDAQVREEAMQQLKRVVRPARLRCKLTQEDVAESVGVDSEVYGRLERGQFVPRVRLLKKLAAVLNVSVDHLIGLDVASAQPPRGMAPPEERLTGDARRVLRAVRELPPDLVKVLTTMGFALIEAKRKRRKARQRAAKRRCSGGG